jgi:diguanylate cyclase (GGDEF)-like protein/PAS domain S-box-containing protein
MSGSPEAPGNFDFKQYAIDNVSDGIYWIDEHGRILEVNNGACKMVGYSKEELKSMTVAQLDPNFPVEEWPAHWDALQEQGSATFESVQRRKDGSIINVEITANMIVYNGHELDCAIVRDITERKKIQSEAMALMQRNQSVMKTTLDGIHILDMQGNVVEANEAFCRILGYTQQEVLGLNVNDFNMQFSAEQMRERLRTMIGKSARFETVHRHKNGTPIEVEVSTTSVEINGQYYFVASSHDITPRKSQQRLMEMMRFSMDHMADKVTWSTPDARIVYANIAACNSLGYTQEEMLKLRIPDFDPDFPLDDWQKHWNELKKFGSLTFESRHRTKNGEIYPVEISANYMRFGNVEYNCGFARDITKRKLAELQIRESEEKLRMLFDNMTTGFALHEAVCDDQGKVVDYRFLEINPAYEKLTGLKSDIIGRTVLDVLPGTEPYWIETFGNVAMTGEPSLYENFSKELGRWYQVWAFCPKIGQFAVIVSDITERKKIEEELRFSSLVLQNSSEGLVVTDADNLIIAVNPAFSSITGYSFEDVKGKNPKMLKSGRHDQAFYQVMWDEIIANGKWQGEIWDKRKNGEIHAKWLTIDTIRDNDGKIHRYVALFSDITEKKKSEELIWRQANFDTLTGLPNRDMFRDRLAQEVKKSIRAELPLALLLVDLDQFKEVNDTLGHSVGDMLLKDAAQRIGSCVRETDTVARLGGDEFTIVLSEISDSSDVDDIAQKIISKLAEPFQLGGEVVHVSASIGITLYPNDTVDIDELIKNADQAMYVAKKKGRNRSSYFTASLQVAAQTKLRLTNDLHLALEAKQFRLHFQPIIAMSTGHIQKAEALLRWQHPERGMIAPMEFIPLAEETGLINEIGDWVFKESARWAKRWCSRFADDFQVSINKSPAQFRAEGYRYAEKWFEFLKELGLSGKNAVIEITEGLLLNADVHVADQLLKLRDAGIQVAIDDFGTGYSSLSYLKKFDIDYLKIDRTFVHNLETDADNMALSEAIIVMAHKLGLKVIAEGVETEGQRKLLAKAGCDFMQGYLFSKAVPPEEFEKLLIAQEK